MSLLLWPFPQQRLSGRSKASGRFRTVGTQTQAEVNADEIDNLSDRTETPSNHNLHSSSSSEFLPEQQEHLENADNSAAEVHPTEFLDKQSITEGHPTGEMVTTSLCSRISTNGDSGETDSIGQRDNNRPSLDWVRLKKTKAGLEVDIHLSPSFYDLANLNMERF
ncbi:hypothetical protein PMAYCL1PPCAC_27193, partial [Pristionchus mayeri]